MNFKKFLISWVSVFTSLAMLAGCGSPKIDKDRQNEAVPDVAVSDRFADETAGINPDNFESTTPSEEATESTPSSYITSMESFMSILGSLVDLSLYGQPYGGEYDSYISYSYSMDLAIRRKTVYNLDYSIKLEDDTEFTLPVVVSEVVNMGWELSSNPEVESNYEFSGPTMVNSKGKEIYPDAVNISTVTKNFSECYLTEYTLHTSYWYDSHPRVTDSKYKGVDFVVCGSITKDSTMEDIISVLGAPTIVSCYIPESGDTIITLEYQQEGNPRDCIKFEISGNFNRVIRVEYSYDPRGMVS